MTTAVGAVVAVSVPALFLSSTTAARLEPTSLVVTVYCAASAPPIFLQVLPVGGQRPHVYLTVGTGSPVHVAATVRIEPTTGVPTIAGPAVNAGFASAPAIAGSHNNAADATAATRAGPPARLRTKAPRRNPPTW